MSVTFDPNVVRSQINPYAVFGSTNPAAVGAPGQSPAHPFDAPDRFGGTGALTQDELDKLLRDAGVTAPSSPGLLNYVNQIRQMLHSSGGEGGRSVSPVNGSSTVPWNAEMGQLLADLLLAGWGNRNPPPAGRDLGSMGGGGNLLGNLGRDDAGRARVGRGPHRAPSSKEETDFVNKGRGSTDGGPVKGAKRYAPGSPEAVQLFREAARIAGVPESWATSQGLHKILKKESDGIVGRPNYTYGSRRNDPSQWPGIHDELKRGIKSTRSSATGLGQLLLSNVDKYYPAGRAGIGDPLQEAAGMLRYIKARYGNPENAWRLYGTRHEGY